MLDTRTAASFFVFFGIICLVSCEDSCEVYRVENGVVLREDLIPIRNSSGHQTGTKAIYLQADTSSSADSGTSLYIRCRDPYRFQGDKTRILAEVTCTNGRWMPFPVCLPPPCYKSTLNYLGLDKSGERIYFNGESFEPKCHNGYRVAEKAEKRVICENGQWTGNLPPCTKEVQCKLPEKPDFGTVELFGKSATIGSVVIFNCESGRTLVGSFVSKCNNLGEWTTPTPRCVASCQAESLLDFEGIIVENRRSLDDGDWLRPRCDEGFELADKDDPKIYCRDGKWEGNLPPCLPAAKASCTTESLSIFGGLIVGDISTVDDGKWLRPQCDEGYDLVDKDDPKIYCRDGKWEGILPPCSRSQIERAACQTESLLDFEGIIAENRLSLNDGEWLEARCDEGFEVADKDDPNIYCRDGKWEGNLPPCTPSPSAKGTCNTVDLLIFHGIIVEENLTLDDGESLDTRCDEGFDVVVTKIYCLDGIWMGNLPPCLRTISKKASCETESLYDFDGLIVEDKGTLDDGEWFEPSCENGFELTEKDDPKIYCRDGKWEGSLPPCSWSSVKAPCETSPLVVFNGLIIGNRLTLDDGEWFRPSCEEGFELADKDDPKIYCRDGRWEGSLPPCSSSLPDKASCETESLLLFNGLIVGSKSTFEDGEWLWPQCEEGFELFDKDDPKLYCRDGNWEGSFPPCSQSRTVKELCEVPSVSNGDLGRYERHHAYRKRTIFKKIRKGATLNEEESLTLRCLSGYFPRGAMQAEMTITCLSGKLSPEPECLIKGEQCGTEPLLGFQGLVLSSIRSVDDGEWIQPMCAEGYEFLNKNSSKLYCRQGRWEGTLPPCYPAPCLDNPPVPENGRVKPTWWKIEHGAHVEYECSRNYDMTEEGSMVCSFGKWTGSVPSCKDKRCYRRDLLHKEGVDLSNDTPVQAFMKADITCIEGYTLKYPEVRCVHGQWQTQNDLSPCQERQCQVTPLDNGEILKEISVPVRTYSSTTIRRDIIYEAADILSLESSGTTLYVSCHDPYSFPGGGESLTNITCRRGKWMPAPLCVLQSTCSISSLYELIPPEVVAYIDEDADSSVATGSVLKLGCGQFEMVYEGNSNAVCGPGGIWNVGSNIYCSHGCNRLKKKPGSELIVSPIKRFYRFGESMTFSCPEGKSLTEDIERILCLKYGWEPNTIPDCQ